MINALLADKSEPTTFSIHDLAHSKTRQHAEGVRNYQARNFLQAMKKGDRAIFYHSNAKPPAAVGIVEVVKESYPDHFAWKEGHKYQDIKASPEKPIWAMVDVKLVQIFPKEISLEQLRGVKAPRASNCCVVAVGFQSILFQQHTSRYLNDLQNKSKTCLCHASMNHINDQ